MTRWLTIASLAGTLAALCVVDDVALGAAPLPKQFEGVDVKERLGAQLDTGLVFTDHDGKRVSLEQYFDGERPVLLTLNYYRCDSICSTQLTQLMNTLKNLDWTPGGEEFQIVTVSFDPNEKPPLASGKRASYLNAYGRGDDVGWSFLTGHHKSIDALTDQLGYQYNYDEKTNQYAHAPVVYVLSGDGRIMRYLYGITYTARDIQFSLMDASDGQVGSLGDKILLSCFAFDADHGAYGAFAWGIMRLGGALTLLILGGWLLVHWRRERRRRLAADPAPSALPPTPARPGQALTAEISQ